jgi:oligoribonuclease NrnB/cAMP/cGMP phosphodiesterase (DHH superfamily)
MTHPHQVEKYYQKLLELVKGGMPITKAYFEVGKHPKWFSIHLSADQKRVLTGLRKQKEKLVPLTVMIPENLFERFKDNLGSRTQKEVIVQLIDNYLWIIEQREEESKRLIN